MKENTYYQHSVGTDVFKYLPCHTTKAVRVRPDEDILPANERSGYCTARILRTDEHYEQKLEDVKQGRCPQLYQRGSTSQTPGVVNCRQLELSEVVGKVLSLSYSFGQGGCACVSDKDQGQHDPSRVGHEPGSYDPSSDPPEDNRDGQTHDPAPLRLLELDEASIGEVPSPDPSQVLRPSEHFPIKKQELDRDPALKAVTYYDHSEITDVFHLPCSWRDEKIEYPKYFCYYAVPRDTEHDSVREYVAERGLCPHTKALPNAEHFAKYHYQRCEWTPYGAVRDGVSAAAAVAGAIPSENGGSCVCVPDVPIFGPADSLGPNPPKGSAGGGGHVLAIVGRT
ncbi:unnamed protein product [Amoebophrya sp. A120]|nr:unnamed protein product [Amoebophrya sp. A120]|eukprot:GSA120T00009958001.1